MTVIVPVMLTGWIVQWYGYEPGSVNGIRNSAPGAKLPESNAPVSEVTVCVKAPVFVQQTVLPGGISTVSGAKKKSPIAMIVSVSWHDPDTRSGPVPADTPACGISSAPKPSATSAATSELRRRWARFLPISRRAV